MEFVAAGEIIMILFGTETLSAIIFDIPGQIPPIKATTFNDKMFLAASVAAEKSVHVVSAFVEEIAFPFNNNPDFEAYYEPSTNFLIRQGLYIGKSGVENRTFLGFLEIFAYSLSKSDQKLNHI